MDSAGVFKNESVLHPEFQPETLSHRDAQQTEIVEALRPAATGRRPVNLLLVGGTGTGKTSVLRHVLGQLEEENSRLVVCFVNAWQHGTRQAVLSEIALKLRLLLVRRGLAPDEILQRIAESLRNGKKTLVLAVDEIDALDGAEGRVLYEFTRLQELYGASAAVIGATNDEGYLAELEPRIRSSFAPRVVPFKPYSPSELKDILQTRADLAFNHGAFTPDAVALAAAHGAKNHGDARVAISVLYQAGREAEKRGDGKVEAKHLRAVIEAGTVEKGLVQAVTSRAALEEKKGALNEVETLIVELLKQHPKGLMSGELYEKFATERGESERTIRTHIASLLAKKIIKTTFLASRQGNTRRIELNG